MEIVFRTLLVFQTLAIAVSGQNIGYGVRGGLPLSDFLKAESKTGAVTNVITGKGNVIIGPALDIRLPLGLGIEADALYRRWNASGPLSTGSASSWEFPIYGKLRTPGIIVRPYVGAGINFQRLGDLTKFLGAGTLADKSRRGFLAAGGLDLKLPVIRVSPEIRYTRWNDSGPIRSTNQVDFLIGLTF